MHQPCDLLHPIPVRSTACSPWLWACLYLGLSNHTDNKSSPALTLQTLSNAATIPSCARRDCSLFMLEKTWTDYLSLDLWVVQWHTGAAMELHNEALWRQRQASLAAPHPGYLISERSLTGAVARSRDSPQHQRRKCQTTWSLGWWRNHRAVSKCRIGDAGGDGGPPASQFTLRMWVRN